MKKEMDMFINSPFTCILSHSEFMKWAVSWLKNTGPQVQILLILLYESGLFRLCESQSSHL